MTNERGPVTGPRDESTHERTVNVLPGLRHLLGRRTEQRAAVEPSDAPEAVEDNQHAEPTDVDDRDIREFLPTQRTPGSGPFGPDDLWDVMYPPEFIERLDGRLRSGEHVAVVSFGMDRFEQVNRNRGPEAGDAALRNAYRILRWTLGPSNVAYFGSDCFAAQLPCEDAETTASLVASALAKLARIDLSDRLTGVFATASAGIIVVDHPDGTADAALYEAEAMLASAKEMGGNRVEIGQFPAPYAGHAESA